jgi:alkylation response protein AidB-like acyl-CoA dehydrogenase
MASLYASEVVVRAADAGPQIHGGIGFVEEAPIGRF